MWYTKNNFRIAQNDITESGAFNKKLLEDYISLKQALHMDQVSAVLIQPYKKNLFVQFKNKDGNAPETNKIDEKGQNNLTGNEFEGQLSDIIKQIKLSEYKDNINPDANPVQKFDPNKDYQPYNDTAAGLKTNNNSAQPAVNTSTPGSSQLPVSGSQVPNGNTPAPAAIPQAPNNPNFVLKDGKVQLTDDAKSKLDTNLQTEAQQMGLSTNKFSTRFNNNINEQKYYIEIIMNHINNGQVTNYTPESRRMIADQILSERREKRNIEQRTRGIFSKPKSVDFKPVNDILFGQPKTETFFYR